MGEEPQRVAAQGDVVEGIFGPPAGDEAAHLESGDRAFEPGLLAVYVLQDEGLAALPVTLDPLVLRRDVEVRRVEVVRHLGEPGLEPLRVVGAELLHPLRQRRIDRGEARDRRALARGRDELLRHLEVGQRLERVARLVLDRRVPLADRVLRVPLAAEGAVVGERHLGEGHGLGGAGQLPEAIADRPDLLVDRPHGEPRRYDGHGLSLRGEGKAREQGFAAHLGLDLVEEPVGAGEPRELSPQGLLLLDRLAVEAHHRADDEDEAHLAVVLERRVQRGERPRLERAHAGLV